MGSLIMQERAHECGQGRPAGRYTIHVDVTFETKLARRVRSPGGGIMGAGRRTVSSAIHQPFICAVRGSLDERKGFEGVPREGDCCAIIHIYTNLFASVVSSQAVFITSDFKVVCN